MPASAATATIDSVAPLQLTLAHRALFQMPASAQEITCDSGSVWVTQDADLHDTVLGPGQRFQADARRRTILYALAPSTVSMRPVVGGGQARQSSVPGLRTAANAPPAHHPAFG